VIEAPLIRNNLSVKLASGAAFVLFYMALYGGAICLAWRIVGAGAPLKRFFSIHFYYAGVLKIIMSCLFLAMMGTIRAGDANLYEEIYDAVESGKYFLFLWENIDRLLSSSIYQLSISIGLIGFGCGLLWILAGWGAYRELNHLSRLRSIVAGVLFALFSVPVLAITGLMANALVTAD
jgi:hypothetical protein